MAFTGTATVVQVAQNVARITGIALGSGATGTIGLAGSGADVELPAGIQWSPYAGDNEGDGVVDLEEACQVSWLPVADPSVGASLDATFRIAVTKANGLNPSAFLITFESFDGGESTGAEMEVYVRFH